MSIADEMRKARDAKHSLIGMDMSGITPNTQLQPTIMIDSVEYNHVPGEVFDREKGLYIATRRRSYDPEKPGWYNYSSWYEAKTISEESGGRLPTNLEWSRTRRYAQLRLPELEADMITGPKECVDLLVDFGEKYMGGIPVPVAVTGTTVVKIENSSRSVYRIQGGNKRELPWLPRDNGDICGWNSDEELPTQIGHSDYRFSHSFFSVTPEGLKAVERGDYSIEWNQPNPEARFAVSMDNRPDENSHTNTFRIVFDEDSEAVRNGNYG